MKQYLREKQQNVTISVISNYMTLKLPFRSLKNSCQTFDEGYSYKYLYLIKPA